MDINALYCNSASNNKDLLGLRDQLTPAKSPDPTQKAPGHTPQCFKSPGFRRAVRYVLTHWGYDMTIGNYAEHSKAANLRTPAAWYESAKNIAISLKPHPTTVDGGIPVSGCFIETKAGNLISLEKHCRAVNELNDRKVVQ
jgi:hypothetical protein